MSHRVRCKTRLRFGSVSPRLSRAFHLVKVVVQVRLRAPLRIEHRIERVVKRAVFVGCRHQLDRSLQAPAFVRKLKDELGVDLDVVHKGRAQEWRDYAAADVVVAVREADPGLHVAKPPSKIINAWLAGVPAILGRESAPRSLRTNDLDFVEVDATPDAVFAALAKMKRDPAYYAQLRARCDVKAAEFSRAALAKKWADLIDEIRPR